MSKKPTSHMMASLGKGKSPKIIESSTIKDNLVDIAGKDILILKSNAAKIDESKHDSSTKSHNSISKIEEDGQEQIFFTNSPVESHISKIENELHQPRLQNNDGDSGKYTPTLIGVQVEKNPNFLKERTFKEVRISEIALEQTGILSKEKLRALFLRGTIYFVDVCLGFLSSSLPSFLVWENMCNLTFDSAETRSRSYSLISQLDLLFYKNKNALVHEVLSLCGLWKELKNELNPLVADHSDDEGFVQKIKDLIAGLRGRVSQLAEIRNLEFQKLNQDDRNEFIKWRVGNLLIHENQLVLKIEPYKKDLMYTRSGNILMVMDILTPVLWVRNNKKWKEIQLDDYVWKNGMPKVFHKSNCFFMIYQRTNHQGRSYQICSIDESLSFTAVGSVETESNHNELAICEIQNFEESFLLLERFETSCCLRVISLLPGMEQRVKILPAVELAEKNKISFVSMYCVKRGEEFLCIVNTEGRTVNIENDSLTTELLTFGEKDMKSPTSTLERFTQLPSVGRKLHHRFAVSMSLQLTHPSWSITKTGKLRLRWWENREKLISRKVGDTNAFATQVCYNRMLGGRRVDTRGYEALISSRIPRQMNGYMIKRGPQRSKVTPIHEG